MKKLFFSAVFLAAGALTVTAQVVKGDGEIKADAKTTLPAAVVKSGNDNAVDATKKSDSILLKTEARKDTLTGTVAQQASGTPKAVTQTVGQGMETAAAAKEARDSVEVKTESKANVNAVEKANVNSAVAAEVKVKEDKQPADQSKEKPEVKATEKGKAKVKAD